MDVDPGEERPELATNEEWRSTMRRARADRTWTQVELGRRVGTSQNMISLIESGEVTSSQFILPICRALSIPPPMFFEDEDDRTWIQLGRLLRRRDMNVFRRALSLVESMVHAIGAASTTPGSDEEH